MAWMPQPKAQGSRPFDQWVAAFRARARERGISDATYTRVMSNLKPDTTVFELDRKQPEFSEELWQYLNRRVSDWRITEGKEKAKEVAPPPRRASKRITASNAAPSGAVGDRVGLRRSAGSDRTTCGRSFRRSRRSPGASARRRSYWEQELLNALIIVDRGWAHAGRDARLLGGRHGPHPMDAGGVAQHGRRLRRRRPRLAVRQARRRARRHRAISPQTRQVPRRRTLGLRGARRRRARQRSRAATRPGRRPASSAPTANRSRSPPRPPSFGCRCRADPHSCSARTSTRCDRTIRR